MIVDQCYRQRLPLPPRIANAPELTIGLDIFYHAFLELGSCRSIGMAEGPIPWLAIQRFCEVNGIDGDLRDDLFYHIHQLDQEYLRWRSKQIAQKSKGSPSGKRSKGVR